jgi:carboxynorspermidine decarboxylase
MKPPGPVGRVPGWAGEVDTPAFVYDERTIHRLLDLAGRFRESVGLKLLFAVKSFSFADALKLMAPKVDGFAVSSLYEARLAREVARDPVMVNITTPGLRPQEVDEIGRLCDSVSFNSLGHWDRYRPRVADWTSCGLRVNPQVSFLDDDRYDPCRPHSKLGVPLEDLSAAFEERPERFAGLRGILFHSNCDSPDFAELYATVERLDALASGILRRVNWVNLGGGYLFEEGESYDGLRESVNYLKSRYDLEVLFEPGSALVREAGYIVSTVLDLFDSGGRTVAVLDTSVNHMPEVLEFDLPSEVLGHDDEAPHEYILAGCTCLAGDLLGEFRFPQELQVGDRVVFSNAGSYTLVKAHMFNGVALPSVYALDTQGQVVLKSNPGYEEFAGRWGLARAARR